MFSSKLCVVRAGIRLTKPLYLHINCKYTNIFVIVCFTECFFNFKFLLFAYLHAKGAMYSFVSVSKEAIGLRTVENYTFMTSISSHRVVYCGDRCSRLVWLVMAPCETSLTLSCPILLFMWSMACMSALCFVRSMVSKSVPCTALEGEMRLRRTPLFL